MFFFFNDTATTEIYTLSLHDALPISAATVGTTAEIPGMLDEAWATARRPHSGPVFLDFPLDQVFMEAEEAAEEPVDRKSTRLNSSHANISYAVFCLKKKN